MMFFFILYADEVNYKIRAVRIKIKPYSQTALKEYLIN